MLVLSLFCAVCSFPVEFLPAASRKEAAMVRPSQACRLDHRLIMDIVVDIANENKYWHTEKSSAGALGHILFTNLDS